MAVSGKGKGKGKSYESDEGKKASDKGKKKVPLDKGKNIVRDDDEEGNLNIFVCRPLETLHVVF